LFEDVEKFSPLAKWFHTRATRGEFERPAKNADDQNEFFHEKRQKDAL
jgi:hypothetical protein